MANNLITFYEDSYVNYSTAVDNGNIDEDALYFLDNGQIYKGTKLLSNVRLVYSMPAKGDTDTVYINKSTGQISFFNGTNYQEIFTPVDEITDDTTSQIPTASAVKKYVEEKSGENAVFSFDSLADFPITGKENAVYIAKSTNKIYRYSEDKNYYVIGSDYNEISEINGAF